MKLFSKSVAHWPPLAWLARCERGRGEIELKHGTGVEVGEDWFAEAVWDGPFEECNFDQTDLVYGSGGRVRDGSWVFVSSGTTLDRLHSHEAEEVFYVSNSLACLTAAIHASVDPYRREYFAFFESIIKGLGHYQPTLATSAGGVRLIYYRNLIFDGSNLREIDKPTIRRDFSEFAGYQSFLTESLTLIGRNMISPARAKRLTPIASISTGYDSPAVATVARHAGLKETLSIVDARGGANDDGSEIARQLDLTPMSFPRDAWRDAEEISINVSSFIASDAKGEDVYFASTAKALAGRVLFTGYRGSRVWEPELGDYPELSRSDQSGLSHTEARLHGHYLHVPLPFMGALQEQEIRSIGRSDALKDWSLGGDYDRPVCRRIVEEAGVSRELFGQTKKAASILLFDRKSFLPPVAQASFSQWCREQQIGQRTVTEGLVNAGRSLVRVRGGQLLELSQLTLKRTPILRNIPLLKRISRSNRLLHVARFEPEFDYLFPWALAEAQKAYL